MENDGLTPREHKVLEAIVRNFILSAEPTGSRFLSKHTDLGLSAASMRNIMGDLEEQGFIAQPHTSAGRVPTDKGYRRYVDQMMEQTALPEKLRERIRTMIESSDHADLRLLLETTSRALSMVTDQLGVVLAPRIARGVFRHVHIFEIEPRRYLLHMTLDSGFVRTITVELESEVSPSRLASACEILNERLSGMRLAELTDKEEVVLGSVDQSHLGVIRLFVPSIRKMLDQDVDSGELYTEGETNIVLKPEFHAPDRLGAIIEVLADRKLLTHLFDSTDSEPGRVVVSIGGENRGGMFESFSVVKAKYQVGNLEGSIGVLGPKRMPYPFLVAAVDYTARLLGEIGK